MNWNLSAFMLLQTVTSCKYLSYTTIRTPSKQGRSPLLQGPLGHMASARFRHIGQKETLCKHRPLLRG